MSKVIKRRLLSYIAVATFPTFLKLTFSDSPISFERVTCSVRILYFKLFLNTIKMRKLESETRQIYFKKMCGYADYFDNVMTKCIVNNRTNA